MSLKFKIKFRDAEDLNISPAHFVSCSHTRFKDAEIFYIFSWIRASETSLIVLGTVFIEVDVGLMLEMRKGIVLQLILEKRTTYVSWCIVINWCFVTHQLTVQEVVNFFNGVLVRLEICILTILDTVTYKNDRHLIIIVSFFNI